MLDTLLPSNRCYHRRPFEDENPVFFVLVPPEDFGEFVTYRCKHCNKTVTFDMFSEEYQIFESKMQMLEEEARLQLEKEVPEVVDKST